MRREKRNTEDRQDAIKVRSKKFFNDITLKESQLVPQKTHNGRSRWLCKGLEQEGKGMSLGYFYLLLPAGDRVLAPDT